MLGPECPAVILPEFLPGGGGFIDIPAVLARTAAHRALVVVAVSQESAHAEQVHHVHFGAKTGQRRYHYLALGMVLSKRAGAMVDTCKLPIILARSGI